MLVVLLAAACSRPDLPSSTTSSPTSDAMLIVHPDLRDKIAIAVLKNAGETASPTSDYRMTGVGDGIGVFGENDKIVVLMNHELKAKQRGAFVSKWILDKSTHQVLSGEVLNREIYFYNKRLAPAVGLSGYEKQSAPISRLCSADLAAPSALSVRQDSMLYGTEERIFFSGEEITTASRSPENRQGRAFAHMVTGEHAGKSYELPMMGRMAFENIVLNPYPQKKTIAMLMDDASNNTYITAWQDLTDVQRELVKQSPPSELYVYVGEKQASGEHPLQRAGLTKGQVYGVRVLDGQCPDNNVSCRNAPNAEIRESWVLGPHAVRFELRKIDVPVNDEDGHGFQIASYQTGVTQFLRLEDGAWDPREGRQNQYYFTTTDEFHGNSRLFRLSFDDIQNPLAGGVIEVVINGNAAIAGREGPDLIMMDNITVDPWGRVLIQEDPGGDPRLAKIWLYDTAEGTIKEIARHNPKYFDRGAGGNDFLTTNEESSGIVHAFDTLGEGWYLLNVQAHAKHDDSNVVEHGQFLEMYVPREF